MNTAPPVKPEGVSVIIPALNASETLSETLESLRAQTRPGWEAIVVDDGSSDATAAIAAEYAQKDPRIRIVSQERRGVSAARNRGLPEARFDWVLFLDADDWIAPAYLERMTAALAADPALGAVYCGWARVTPQREVGPAGFVPQSTDLFEQFARTCVFAIHACVVRHALVEAVGEFDTTLHTCEDWDLWQRIARTGARFGRVDEVLAFYRMRDRSASLEIGQLLADGLAVISRGHGPDPRVAPPHPEHAQGAPRANRAAARLGFASWVAGLAAGAGQDPQMALGAVADDHDPTLDPQAVAQMIFWAVPLPSCRTPAAWGELWPEVATRLAEFLVALEAQARGFGIARRAQVALERLVVEHAVAAPSLTIGAAQVERIEVTQPLREIRPPAPVERLFGRVECEGERIGTIELPVCDGGVPATVLADAVAAECTWSILGRFFERSIYPELKVDHAADGCAIWRGPVCLGRGLEWVEDHPWRRLHDQIGWAVFLQEIWGRPEWPNDRFYDTSAEDQAAASRRAADAAVLTVEVSADLPEMVLSGRPLSVVLTVGGTAIGVTPFPAEMEGLSAQGLRATLTGQSGFELCIAAVREGVLGRPLVEGGSLRQRLARAAAAAAGSSRAQADAASSSDRILVFGRRLAERCDTSASRWAALPAGAAAELTAAATVAGDPIVHQPADQPPTHVLYAPDQLVLASDRSAAEHRARPAADSVEIVPAPNARGEFEAWFSAAPDPWRYDSEYEQVKYHQTLDLLPNVRIDRALELACAEGHFTVQLAPRVRRLIAADVSQIALNRAAERCARADNVRFVRLDLTRDPLPGSFDLIVCSEVLYYTGSREALQDTAHRIALALNARGYLLTAHANLVVDEPDRTGFDWGLPFGVKVIGETFLATGRVQLISELRTPLYRIQLFRRAEPERQRRQPKVTELAQVPAAPLPHVAADILWGGGAPRKSITQPTAVTDRLPILMYHRVADDASPSEVRYRVTPQRLEEQLAYLRDVGYYSIGLDRWRDAIAVHRALPGRAVLITFDDGYEDFFSRAWPLLKQYGFGATVFLVAEEVGRSNRWDRGFMPERGLLTWPQIRALQDEGVEFGSHSATHQPLTALTPSEIVREAARSRAILERELGRPVPAFAYPHGAEDRATHHLVGASGYVYGLTCRYGRSSLWDRLLALPRIEVKDSDGLEDFVRKIQT